MMAQPAEDGRTHMLAVVQRQKGRDPGAHRITHDGLFTHEPEVIHLQEMIEHNFRLLSRAEAGVIARELSPEELLYSAQH